MTQGRFRGLCKLSGLVVAWVVLLGLGNLQAQTFTVTATQYSDLVQFVAQGEATALRVEVFSISGQKLFDSGVQPETTAVDWRMLNRQGRPVPNGVYLYAVTVKDASGKTSKQLGKVAVMRGQEPILSTPNVGELNQVIPLNHNLNHCQWIRINGVGLRTSPVTCKVGIGVDNALLSGTNAKLFVLDTGTGSAIFGLADGSGGTGVSGQTSNAGVGVFALNSTGLGGVALRARNISSLGDHVIEAFGSDLNDVKFFVTDQGNVRADGTFASPAADFAEMMNVSGLKEQYEPGDVLVIGSDGKLSKATTPYATNLAGVYSTKPSFLGGDTEVAEQGIKAYEKRSNQARVPMAILGVVPVKASAENGAIKPGDMLTTSSLAGYAMKATDPKIGAILGKALESLEQGTGIIMVLVTLR